MQSFSVFPWFDLPLSCQLTSPTTSSKCICALNSLSLWFRFTFFLKVQPPLAPAGTEESEQTPLTPIPLKILTAIIEKLEILHSVWVAQKPLSSESTFQTEIILIILEEAGRLLENILVTAEEVWHRVETGEISEKLLSTQLKELIFK